MILLFSEYSGPRLNYILKFIFNKLIGCEFQITTNSEAFENYTGPKISYSQKALSSGLWIKSSDFIFDNNLQSTPVVASENIWGKVFFANKENSVIPFDIFSASFYIISRYEEYLPFEPDKLGRFPYFESVLYKNDILSKPIINIWVKKLSDILVTAFPNFTFSKPGYNFISTIDIDNAFAFKEKGFYRNTGGFIKSLVKADINKASERLKVLSGKQPDPYDTYDFIYQIHKTYNIKPIIFVLNGKYGKYDKNISPVKVLFNDKLIQLGKNCEFGIHPSFRSNFTDTLRAEKTGLEEAVCKKISISRQHFLILKFPDTYLRLVENRIDEDYSMGYSRIAGFRAGTCSPFPFFDLKNNRETTLIVYPFSWMDRTLRQFLKQKPDEAVGFITENINMIKEYGGTFVSLWHNESLGNTGYWKNWKPVYEHMMKTATV